MIILTKIYLCKPRSSLDGLPVRVFNKREWQSGKICNGSDEALLVGRRMRRDHSSPLKKSHSTGPSRLLHQ